MATEMDDTYGNQQQPSQVKPEQWMHLTGDSLDSLVDDSVAPVAHGDYEQFETHTQVVEVLMGLVAAVADLDV